MRFSAPSRPCHPIDKHPLYFVQRAEHPSGHTKKNAGLGGLTFYRCLPLGSLQLFGRRVGGEHCDTAGGDVELREPFNDEDILRVCESVLDFAPLFGGNVDGVSGAHWWRRRQALG